MRLHLLRFNIYLLLLALVGATGCKSSELIGDKTAVVPVFRDAPMLVRITKEPILDEGHLTDARLVDSVGGFAIQVKFDFRGTLTLESVTSSYRGQRLVLYSMFTEGRWLAAPKITTSIKDGILLFTPDANREEAERIVNGLNNVAIELGNKPKPGKEKKPEATL